MSEPQDLSKDKKMDKSDPSKEKKKDSGEKKKKDEISPKISEKKKKDETVQIEEYQINPAKDCIGEGGFGVVYRGYNTNTGEFVAIKQIPLKNKKKEDILVIKNEISLMAGLNDPHIVRYIDNKEKGGYLYIVMEYLETGSLSSLSKRYKLTEEMISKYILQVLEGLKYLHGEGIIHRDIKGDNVLLTKKSEIKLADFGVAQALDDNDENDVAGTPNWMAPEIISLAGAQYTSDIWSVGCMIIELLTGHPPYWDVPKMSAMYKIVMDDHPPMPGGLTSACMDFLMFCFKKDPGLRKGATELLKHPWVSKTEIPKQVTPKKEPVVVKQPVKPVVTKVEVNKLSKWKEDDDDDVGFKKPLSKTLASPGGVLKKPIVEDSWDDLEDDDSMSSGSSTVAKGSAIVKKLQEMKIKREEDKDWRKQPVPESPMNALQGKSKSIAKWTEDDDDIGFITKKTLRISITNKSNDMAEEDLEQAFEQDIQDIGDFNQDKQHEDEFLRVLTTLAESSEEQVKKNIEKLLEFAQDVKLQKIFNAFMKTTCLIPIIDILASSRDSVIQTNLLKLLRIICKDNKETQENLALIGAFPKIMKFSAIEYPKEVRQEANLFIHYLCMESKNIHGVQMFIASAGLPVLTRFLKHSPQDIQKDVSSQEMITRSLDIILHLLNLTAGKNHKRDFCRLFSESDILIEFYNILNNLKTFDSMGQSIFSICNIFSTYGDKVVKQGISGKEIMKSLFACLAKISPDQKLMIFNIVRNLTYEVHESLVATGVLSVLVQELKKLISNKDITITGSMSQKMFFPVMNSLYALCVGPLQLGREFENETVANEGIIPLLYESISKKLPLVDISLRLLNKVSVASVVTGQMFVASNGLQFFFTTILKNSDLNAYHVLVLDKIVAFLNKFPEDTQKVLIQKENIKIVCDVFKERNIDLMMPFFNIINRSNKAAALFSVDVNFLGIFEKWMNHFKDPKDLKRMIEVLDKLYENCETKSKFVAQFKDLLIMKSKSPNKQLVRNVANALLDKFKLLK